jgi:hypothetical protein
VRLRITARGALRGVVALGVAVAVVCAGTLVVIAVAFARLGSKWDEVEVYRDVRVDPTAETWSMPVDVYAQPPLHVVGWVVASALIAAAYAITVWGLWLLVRVVVGARGPGRSGLRSWKPTSIATSVFAWGIAALSAYSLVIFVWDWVEWRNVLDAGLTFAYDPKPEPNAAYDPWQIPLGIIAFAAIGALPVVVRSQFRRRPIMRGATGRIEV